MSLNKLMAGDFYTSTVYLFNKYQPIIYSKAFSNYAL